MAYCKPPTTNRWGPNNPPPSHTQKHPNGYFLPRLKRLLEKKIRYTDPDTNKIIKGNVKDALLWRLILNGTEGDTHAINSILDRIDGKVAQRIEGMNGRGDKVIIQVINAKNDKDTPRRKSGASNRIEREADAMLGE